VSEVDEFLADVLPRLRAAEIALHEGDPGPRAALWSHHEPVTLFGAEVNRTGRPELERTFDWIATRFTACTSLDTVFRREAGRWRAVHRHGDPHREG
jgi:hypothetical protein